VEDLAASARDGVMWVAYYRTLTGEASQATAR
jgi:hypothetical protein